MTDNSNVDDKFMCAVKDCILAWVGDEGCAFCINSDEAFYCQFHQLHPHEVESFASYQDTVYNKKDRVYGYYRGLKSCI